MNYLVIEGYKDAAEQFSQEASLAPTVDLSSIQDRMDIRHAIQSGHIEAAIERVNDLDPEVHFSFCDLSFSIHIFAISCFTSISFLFRS